MFTRRYSAVPFLSQKDKVSTQLAPPKKSAGVKSQVIYFFPSVSWWRAGSELSIEHRELVTYRIEGWSKQSNETSKVLNLECPKSSPPAKETQRKKLKCHSLELCFFISEKKIQLMLLLTHLINIFEEKKIMVVKAIMIASFELSIEYILYKPVRNMQNIGNNRVSLHILQGSTLSL